MYGYYSDEYDTNTACFQKTAIFTQSKQQLLTGI